jgi:hypothetical protein
VPVVINEAAVVDGFGSVSFVKLVELRNVSSAPVDVSGWFISPCASTAPAAIVPANVTLAPDELFLFGPPGFAAPTPDAELPITSIRRSEGVKLHRADGALVDGVAFEEFGGPSCREGSLPLPFTVVPTGQSIGRNGAGTDTDVNKDDFTVQASSLHGRGFFASAAVTLTAPTGEVPASVPGSGALDVTFTSSQAGDYVLESKPDAAGDEAWAQLGGAASSGAAVVGANPKSVVAPADPGTYDVRVRFSNANGSVASERNGALIVSTPAAAVSLTAPSAALPVTRSPNGSFDVGFSSDQAGSFVVQAKPVLAGDDGYVTLAGGSGTAVVGTNTVSVTAPEVSGTFDLRVQVTNDNGTGTGAEAGAVIVSSPAAVTLDAPVPATVAPSGAFSLTFGTDQVGDYALEVKPDAAAEDQWVALGGASSGAAVVGANAKSVSAPSVEGVYDLRVRVTNANGTTTTTLNAALTVDEPTLPEPAVVRLQKPTTEKPVTVAPNKRFDAKVKTDQPGDYVLEFHRVGQAGDVWVALGGNQADGTIDVAGVVTVSVRGPVATGRYDVRVRFTNANGEVVHVRANALRVRNA